MRPISIAPSILAANFAQLELDVARVVKHHVEYLHYDIMDGHFVPNLSFGVPVVASLTPKFKVIHDVHLMVEKPRDYFDTFMKARANIITFHYEVGKDIKTMLQWMSYLQGQGIKAGISIKPNTKVDVLLPFIGVADVLLIMSVEPGFGGQVFLPSAIAKIQFLRHAIDQKKAKTLIEVDGGINAETALKCRQAGVDVLVAGSFIFQHPDLAKAIASLRHE
jgi:ribulose-phosphate 3-epimerase